MAWEKQVLEQLQGDQSSRFPSFSFWSRFKLGVWQCSTSQSLVRGTVSRMPSAVPSWLSESKAFDEVRLLRGSSIVNSRQSLQLSRFFSHPLGPVSH